MTLADNLVPRSLCTSQPRRPSVCVCEGVQAEPVLVPGPVPPPVPGLHHRGAGAPNIFKPRGCQVQRDQINMAVFFWYLVKSDLPTVRQCTYVHWTVDNSLFTS